MHLIRTLAACPPSAQHCVIALGNFDGLHLGHQAVIETTRSLAKGLHAPTGILTFEPHPRTFFTPTLAPLRIYPLATKIALLRALAVDTLFVKRFDAAFASLTAEAFIRDVLVSALRVRHVVTGADFTFGHKRGGNVDMLDAAAKRYGFGFTRIEGVKAADGQACSSTRIRALLAEGKTAETSTLLGRPYAITGRVIHGDTRGRVLGFPTLNISLQRIFTPAHGVYAVRAHLPCGTGAAGVANIGVRPTFGGTAPLLEAHLFDTEADLYGTRVKVELVQYLRPERRFADAEALAAQIKKDCEAAKSVLSVSLSSSDANGASGSEDL